MNYFSLLLLLPYHVPQHSTPCDTLPQIIQLMKCSDSVSLMLAHTNFDGKGCPETTLDRNSPLQSPVSVTNLTATKVLCEGERRGDWIEKKGERARDQR